MSAPRSGTHSVAGLFATHYRSRHEPDRELLFRAIYRWASGDITQRAFQDWLRQRDKTLWLEMESDQLLGHIAGPLAAAFPDARFVLVIRDCYSWLASQINNQLTRPLGARADWLRTLLDWRYQADRFTHAEAERPLAARGLYTLDGYLSFWAARQNGVLAAVPEDRLLVLRMDQLTGGLATLAAFLDVPVDSLDNSRSHEDRRDHDATVLRELDPAHLQTRVQHHCGDLMARFFPEIRTLEDAFPLQ